MAKKKQKKVAKAYVANNKYGRNYEEYKERFKYEKKLGNVKRGVRMLSEKQYNRVRKEDGYNNKTIIEKQTILTEKMKKKVIRDLNDANIRKGQFSILENTFFGESEETMDLDSNTLGYHRTLSGFLHDRYALHYLIASRITMGETQEEVLADYGY